MSSSSSPAYLQYLPLTLGLPKIQKDVKEKLEKQRQQDDIDRTKKQCIEIDTTEKTNKVLEIFKKIFIYPIQRIKEYFDKQRGGYGKHIFITTVLAYACVCVIVVMSLFLILQLQYDIYKKKGDELYETRKIPYKTALEYQAVQSLELFSRYPYQAIYILAIIGSLLVFARYLFIKQQSFDDIATGKTADEEDAPYKSTAIFYICIYCFAITFICIQLIYRKRVEPIKSKVDDFNQYVRSLLPANYDFLKTISIPPALRISIDDIPKVMIGITPNVRDLSRCICVINLYYYYIAQYPDGDSNLATVLSCFDPVNRLVLTQGACFSDYLIRNDTFIDNKVISILRSIENLEGTNDVKTFITNRTNRLEILTNVDVIMNKLNEKSNCLDSTSAFMHFTRMAWMIFLLTWIPLILYGLFLYWLRDRKC